MRKSKKTKKESPQKSSLFFKIGAITLIILAIIGVTLYFASTLSYKQEKKTPTITIKEKPQKQEKIEKPITQKPENSKPKKPKLAIIIDDVQTSYHIKELKKLNLLMTYSFLPPSKTFSESAKLAQKEKYYMVHLPLETEGFAYTEPNTIMRSYSTDEIKSRLDEIKKLFPGVKLINNHTGSTFTADKDAVKKLLIALKDKDIDFLDSVTKADTTVPDVSKELNLTYIRRDLFLDHSPEKKLIKEQISKAINIAFEKGQAIVIAHPRKTTFEAFKESKEILEKVELVLVKDLL